MIWVGIAAFLVLWFIGLLLNAAEELPEMLELFRLGPLVNLLLVVAAVLLVVQVINERDE